MNAAVAQDLASAVAAAVRFIKIGSTGEQLAADAPEWDAVLDTRLNVMWSARDITKGRGTFKTDEKACADLELASFSDWRLPTVEELFLLADRTRVSPAIDVDYFPSCKNDWYRASSPWASDPAVYAWGVGFSYGGANGCGRDYDACVRAVRSVVPAGQ